MSFSHQIFHFWSRANTLRVNGVSQNAKPSIALRCPFAKWNNFWLVWPVRGNTSVIEGLLSIWQAPTRGCKSEALFWTLGSKEIPHCESMFKKQHLEPQKPSQRGLNARNFQFQAFETVSFKVWISHSRVMKKNHSTKCVHLSFPTLNTFLAPKKKRKAGSLEKIAHHQSSHCHENSQQNHWPTQRR